MPNSQHFRDQLDTNKHQSFLPFGCLTKDFRASNVTR